MLLNKNEIHEDDFNVNFSFLKSCWKKLYSGFYDWFLTHYKKGFVESGIQSACPGMYIGILYYQSNVKAFHAIGKWSQCSGKASVLDAADIIRTLIAREENDEILASYDFGKHVLSQTYKNWFTLSWHSWLSEKGPHKEQTFVKSFNAGEKSGYYQRIIWPNFRSVALAHNSVSTSATLLSLVIVSTTTASLSSSHLKIPASCGKQPLNFT